MALGKIILGLEWSFRFVSFRFITFLACKDILGAHIKDWDWTGLGGHFISLLVILDGRTAADNLLISYVITSSQLL